MQLVRFVVGFAMALGVAFGCSSSDDSPPIGSIGGGSSSSGDGGSRPTEAGTLQTDAEVVRTSIANGSFEQETGTGCGATWNIEKGNGVRISVARTGKFACRVCNGTDTKTLFGVMTNLGIAPRQGTWTFRAFARVEPEASGVLATQGGISATAQTPSGPVQDQKLVALTSSWQEIAFDLAIPAGATSLEVRVFGEGDPGACVDLDDVTVTSP